MGLPFRLIIALLGVYACALVYTQRSAMSVAIVAMTTTKYLNENAHNSTGEELKPEFDWNEKLQVSQTLSFICMLIPICFLTGRHFRCVYLTKSRMKAYIFCTFYNAGSQFYLYIISPAIAGFITDKFGAKWVNFMGAIVPCVLSLVTPIGVRKGGVGALIAIRTIDGAFHGCVYASLFSLYTKWFTARERAMANGSTFFGGSVGSTIMYALAGWACQTDIGWPLVYYINATLYIPWMILWIYFCSNDPAENRHISPEELSFLKENVAQPAAKVRGGLYFGQLTQN